jgi:glycosyltransferase involved in cell wall biosynthesis
MALRVPAIAFDAAGVGEIVDDGVSGLLVPPGDDHRFAEAVATLVADPSRRLALGNAGPARADSFGVSAMVEQTLALYRDVTVQRATTGTSG